MIYNLPRAKKKGETWYLNESIDSTAIIIDNIEFTSNSKTFTKIWINYESRTTSFLLYDSEEIASIHFDIDTRNWSTNWENEAYRTITLASPATGDLLTWLQSNAVKQ